MNRRSSFRWPALRNLADEIMRRTAPHIDMNPASALHPPPGDSLISVIIPALNEAAMLPGTLTALRSSRVPFELILVDGGSSDESVAFATAASAKIITSSRRQRAHQLNLGAQEARGDILLFLHADTVLPEGGLDLIARELSEHGTVGGAFARRYNSPSLLLRTTCLLAAARNRLIGWHLGDQAIFVRRTAFFYLGGFQEVDMFEDVDFSRRMNRFGRIVTISPGVVSSPRRFSRAGPAFTTLRDLGLTIRYLAKGLPIATESKRTLPSQTYAAIKTSGYL